MNTLRFDIGPSVEAIELCQVLEKAIPDEAQVEQLGGTGLLDQQTMRVIVALSSTGSIGAVAKVLTAWIAAKRERIVRIGSTELKGYSADEVSRILASQLHLEKEY